MKTVNKRWYQIKSAGDVPEVYIYDEIGGWGVLAKEFIDELNALDASAFDLRINSPGGSVFQGNPIYNAIKRHPATVTAYIDGLAASMASVVALAADQVYMAANGLYMIHNPWTIAAGDADELRGTADTMDKLRAQMVNVYADKTGMEPELVSEFMTEETWFDAQEALDNGFIDGITDALEAAAHFDLSNFEHAPAALPYAAKAFELPSNIQEKQTKSTVIERSLRI